MLLRNVSGLLPKYTVITTKRSHSCAPMLLCPPGIFHEEPVIEPGPPRIEARVELLYPPLITSSASSVRKQYRYKLSSFVSLMS
jgi:hypothetical protein